MKLAGLVAASAASAALVAGGTAAASTQASSKTVTGPEVIAGTVHGKAAFAKVTVIPLAWVGLVRTHSVISWAAVARTRATPRRSRAAPGT